MTLPHPGTVALDPADARRLDWARRTVAAMTREERIAQLHQYAPGVPRLGIGRFVTGTEGVHGVAWKGEATQFPQPVGLAASWDPELLRSAAAVVAAEVREKRAADPGVSLTVWAPVVNLLRHPLWGRTEEAYTEDPLLNAELACGYSAGLRGPGGTWTTVPTLKHFLAYSNETDRAATSSDLSPRVLAETELPGFAEPLRRGVAGSVMLSYNLVNGRAAHLTDLLERELRSVLPDPDLLFVVSDAGAPSNLVHAQKVVPDQTHGHAAMLRAGVDSFTDHDTDPTETIAAVTAALAEGLVEDAHVERAVVRQLVARARTGEFGDLAADAPVGAIGTREVVAAGGADTAADRAGRRALAREAAVRGTVLLAQQDPDALPLPDGPLAVIGRQAQDVLRDWYSGEFPAEPGAVGLAAALTARRPGAVRVAAGTDIVSLAAVSDGEQAGVPADGCDEEPVRLRPDGSLALPRPATDLPGGAPASFEVLELGEDLVALREQGTGRLVTVDDRGYLVARAERIGGWVVQETFFRSGDDPADPGAWVLRHTGSGRHVGIEHGTGSLVLRDADPATAAQLSPTVLRDGAAQVAEAVDGARAVVLAVGNDPHVHGRETADRPHVLLPDPDRRAARWLADLPAEMATVLVITSSYPYDLEGIEHEVGAVVWSSHAGEAEGEALADVLLGDRQAAGRLAQTWPASDALPPLLDYDLITTRSTGMYGAPARFPLGHGLAVDRVAWDDAALTLEGEEILARVALTAPADRRTAGPLHEVVQVYAEVPASSFSRRRYQVPLARLVGFAALEVPATGTAVAEIRIPVSRLALFAPDRDAWELPDGPVSLRISRSSAPGSTVHAETLTLPAAALPPVPSGEVVVGAERAEGTDGLARCAASLLEGTELRPVGAAPGTADLVLPAGTEVLELITRGDARAELVDPAAEDPADAPALPLPHPVPGDDGRPTGHLRVRLTGGALRGLRVRHP